MGESEKSETEAFWKRRSLAFLFFASGIGGLLLAMSVSIESVRIKRKVIVLNGEVVRAQSRAKELEEEVIGLTREARLRKYARDNQLKRALPAEVLYLP